jgi:prepilin-type N-terminal cleavage/methylation domain-containing protein
MKRSRGFTLIEVLATLMLLAIVLPVAMRGVQIALRSASNAKHTAEASALAETKLNELIVTGQWASSSAGGDFSPEHPEYAWTFENVPRDYNLNEVFVTVTWTERGMPRTIRLATLAYQSGGGVP